MALAMPIPTIESPMGDFAQWYAAFGLPVCPALGKAPKITKNGYYDATTDPAQITAWWQEYPYANIAIRMGGLWWTLDVDVHNGGAESLEALLRDHDDLPRTVTSETGSQNGSVHMLWRVPEGVVIPTCKPWKGIDVQGDPSCIIVPPSLHPETMKRYQWRQTLSPADLAPVEAPEWLVELVLQQAVSSPGKNGVPFDPQAIIPEGQRENTFLSMMGGLYARGFSASALRQLLDAENVRCDPPMTAQELDRVIERIVEMDAKRHPGVNRQQDAIAKVTQLYPNTAPPGYTNMGEKQTAANDAPAPPPLAEHWRSGLFEKKNRELYQNVTNIKLLLQNHPHWQDPINALWWDAVRGRPMMGSTEIDNTRMIDVCDWFGRGGNMPVTRPALVETCVIAQCHAQERDLLRHWLESLPAWNKEEHLTTWLHDIAGARKDTYGQETARVLLVSMVARAMDPGCHYRFVVIFQGDEEIGKTALVRAIATREWYVELSMNLESKESMMMLQGVWVAEMSELDSLTRTEETRLKGFITQAEDSYVPKFSNFREKAPRRAIFVGTTNDDCFLKGQSGNTRYLPITLPHAVDLPRFTAMRDQLFAEALSYYREHPEDWWQLTSDALELAREEREHRRVANPYEQPLHEWLTITRTQRKYYEEGDTEPVKFEPGETSWPEIARWFLKLETPEKWKDRSLQMQIGSALRAIGWRVRQTWRHGRNTNVWYQASEDA